MMNQNISILRAGVLIVFVIALLGPWTFDQINVPAEFDCSAPFIRLNDDFCGMPMSGVQLLWLWVGGFFYMLLELITGGFTGQGSEFFFGLSILPLIPFFTTLLLLWKKDARQFRIVHLVAWVLALIVALVIFIPQINDPIARLWGLWLYILLAVSAIVIEILVAKNTSSSS